MRSRLPISLLYSYNLLTAILTYTPLTFILVSPSAYTMARDWGQYVDTVAHDRAGKGVNSKDFGVCMMTLIYCGM